jgi:hypothetical protein
LKDAGLNWLNAPVEKLIVIRTRIIMETEPVLLWMERRSSYITGILTENYSN